MGFHRNVCLKTSLIYSLDKYAIHIKSIDGKKTKRKQPQHVINIDGDHKDPSKKSLKIEINKQPRKQILPNVLIVTTSPLFKWEFSLSAA